MIVIGIDPGLTGAIAALRDGAVMALADLPTMANGKGKSKVKRQINPATLIFMLSRFKGTDAVCCVERVASMPGQGVAGIFSFGHTCGCIFASCAANGLPVEMVTPRIWKKFYNLGKDKDVTRTKAIELYPLKKLARKKDHNRAEAILIARWYWLTHPHPKPPTKES